VASNSMWLSSSIARRPATLNSASDIRRGGIGLGRSGVIWTAPIPAAAGTVGAHRDLRAVAVVFLLYGIWHSL
jgi:hypothetical protein